MYVAPVVEVFQSIQGEGKNVGKPSVFVRMWNCNLRCQFNGIECDTPYAVYKEKEKAEMLDEQKLADLIRVFKTKHIIFTGGEPTLYQCYIEAVMRILRCYNVNYTAEVETNGTIVLQTDFQKCINHFNISVKLKSSNQPNEKYEKLRKNYKALDSFPHNKSCFKFVIFRRDDMPEILRLHKRYPQYPVYLMPEGITREAVIRHSPEVVDICIQYGFMFSPREQIIIWDMKRGV